MQYFRHITTTIAVVFLSLVMGLGSAAHALSKGCGSWHCDDLVSMTADEHNAGHASAEETDSTPLRPTGIEHDGCSPFLCHVLALMSQISESTIDRSEVVMAWQVGRLATLEVPDNPDRPPNL